MLHKIVFVIHLDTEYFGKLSSLLSETIIIDCSDYQYENKYQKHPDQLIKIILEESDYYQQHKNLLVKAMQWEKQNQYPTLLLRGKSLKKAIIWLETSNKYSRYQPIELQTDYILTSSKQPTVTSFDIFIAHAYCDVDFVDQLNDALEIQGKTSDFEPHNPENTNHEEIEIKEDDANGLDIKISDKENIKIDSDITLDVIEP